MGAFFKSFWSQMGRSTGKRVSNAIFGDKWSTPYRVGGSGRTSEKKTKAGSGRKAGSASYRTTERSCQGTSADRPVFDSGAYTAPPSAESLKLTRELLGQRNARRKNLAEAVRRVSTMPIPRSEEKLEDMLTQLSMDFSGAKAMLTSEYDDEAKRVCKTLRNVVFHKYSRALETLESRWPDNPNCWSFFLAKWRMFFSRKPWSWIWVVYAVVLFLGTYDSAVHRYREDVLLVCALWAVPVVAAICVLVSRRIRMQRS